LLYNLPSDLNSALQLLVNFDGKIIAGGTDVYPSAKQGQMPRNLVDLSSIPEISGITFVDDLFRIGATTTWSEIVKAELPCAFDALKQAALEIGSIQIQNAGTIGGNICNASPAADSVPPLLALDARVELQSAKHGTRILKLSDFILHVRKTALGRDELVTALVIPRPSQNAKSSFEKLGSRRYLVISITMVAAVIECTSSGIIEAAKIAVGSCSPVAQRLEKLEADIIGLKPEQVEVTPDHLATLSPIDDVRGSKDYRMEVVAKQCERAIIRAANS
jgi:CO/xanthine dehydrogenase FAD-binding subunit